MLSFLFFTLLISPGQSINEALLREPQSLRIDHLGRILVVDSGFHRVIVCDPDGLVLFIVGKEGSGPGEFLLPGDVRVTPSGRIMVADRGNWRVQLFDEEGSFLQMVKVSEQTVGTLLVTGEDRFILAKNNGFGIKIKMQVTDEERRFREYDLKGNTLRRFGELATHKNPMLRSRLNYGPMTMIKGVPVLGGSIVNELIFYGEKERRVTFKPGFEFRAPNAFMKKFKNSQGHFNYEMRVVADWICLSLAAIGDDALLMLRATEQSPERGRPPASLVKFDLEGKELNRYPGVWEASSVAVSPDGKTAWLIVENDDGWHLERVVLE